MPAAAAIRPWLMLLMAMLAGIAQTFVTAAPAFFIPLLHDQRGLSLAEAGLVAAMPNLGVMATLVLWGAAADRWGERAILATGLGATAIACIAAVLVAGVPGYWALGAALLAIGAASAGSNTAGGRLVAASFPAHRRGLAMGIRQTSQPLGVAIGALAVPALVASGDLAPALWVSAAACAVPGLLAWWIVRDPARPPKPAAGASANPYRGHSTLQRIHAASALLVVPQFALSTFGLVWFVAGFGWSALAAGAVVAVSQLLGALGRVAVGALSDRVRSRVRPLRWVAIAGIAALLVTAAFGLLDWAWPAAIAYVVASCIGVADNGLAYTSVAELAGPHWAGRALGIQNTGQFLGAAITAPAVGALIGAIGYPLAWAVLAVAPLLALPLVPRAAVERVGP